MESNAFFLSSAVDKDDDKIWLGLLWANDVKESDAVFTFVVKLSSGKTGASELRKGSVFSNIFSINVPH